MPFHSANKHSNSYLTCTCSSWVHHHTFNSRREHQLHSPQSSDDLDLGSDVWGLWGLHWLDACAPNHNSEHTTKFLRVTRMPSFISLWCLSGFNLFVYPGFWIAPCLWYSVCAFTDLCLFLDTELPVSINACIQRVQHSHFFFFNKNNLTLNSFTELFIYYLHFSRWEFFYFCMWLNWK